jgi:aminomethyltransferase
MKVHMEYKEDLSLVAVQGPGSMAAVQKLVPDSIDLVKVGFMVGFDVKLAGIEGCRLTRCGYTGEDGFELSVPNDKAVELVEVLLSDTSVKPAGLGARDSLRLEAGLCLYGNDIDGTTTPVEAGLTWTIGGPKTRRRKEQVAEVFFFFFAESSSSSSSSTVDPCHQ